ncbi:MAG: DUF779 domain-containing protein [Thermaerobacter sp.]|nr:DUF779 domain-containing protein [Thermaerobacter sp.]
MIGVDQGAQPRVSATEQALALIERLKAIHGPLLFYQSGGCCDGSAPMCYPDGEFRLGEHDLKLGSIGGCPFYIAAAQYRAWGGDARLLIDVVPGRGGSFSLESPEGMRFITRTVNIAPEPRTPLPGSGPENAKGD